MSGLAVALSSLRQSWRNVLRHRRRSAAAIGSVAFGVVALVLASGFIEHIFFVFRDGVIRSQYGHLQIVRPGYHDAGRADPRAYLLPETLPDLESAGGRKHIKAIAPRLSFSGLVSSGESTVSFLGEGVSPRDEEAFFSGDFQMAAGANLAAEAPREVIVGEGLARNLGIGLGARVVLLAATARGGTSAVEVKVRGLFSTAAKDYDDVAIRLPLTTARQLLRTSGAHAWVILLDGDEQTRPTLARLQALLPGDRFEVVPWYRLADFYNKTVELFTKQVDVVRLIIALIIVLSISNTMMMSVMERTGEIGTGLALGMRRSDVLRLFLGEGLVLGLLGGLLGISLGWLLAAAISAVGIPMPPPPGQTTGFIGKIMLTGSIVGGALLLAVGTALLASVYRLPESWLSVLFNLSGELT